ncbi:MAG: outer membrane beta-barrel protein [Chitinophagaceae bacterium]|nr:outer membrane beta-barrel protein [Chitinophagaceae bacterium]
MYKRLLLILLKLFLATLLFVFSVSCFGQETPVSIKIINQKKEPVAFASVTVINRLDSIQIIKKVADSSGIARFNLSKNNQYTINITSINYQPIEKGISTSGNQTSFSFIAEPLGKTLETAIITSKKPLMKQEDDKLIIDPENLVAASTSGYEVIEKTPGLFVDQDGNIYISSMTPATVQINGRDMRMSAADVATMLKGLPPDAISKIEIVKTPSAKYDASSSGGIVNVILKKGVKIGMTGSVNAGIQQGTYGNQFIGFNLNNNDGKKNSYINFNYSKRNSYEKIITDRIFAPDSMLSQNAFTKYPSDVFYTGYGLTYTHGKWDIDFSGSITLNYFNNNTENLSAIQKISTSQLLTNNLNSVINKGSSLVIGNGIETKLKIDSLGSEWSTQLFYYNSHNISNQAFSTSFYTPALPTNGGDGKADNKRDLFSAKSDLKLKMKKKFTFETGVKSTFHLFKNITNYFRESVGIRTKDNNRTNSFNYDENINSLYLQGSKTLGKDFVIKTGVRMENTNMKGRQIIPSDTTFNIHRTDLFPYIYLSKNLMKIASYDLRAYLVYRRTINRPGYDQLNPFSRFIDQYLSETGNPSLRPQFNQNYEANVSVDERPILAVGVNDTRDIFTNVIYQSDTSQSQAYRTYDNLGKNKEWYFRGLGAIPPGGRYFFVLGAQYNHNFYQGLYENKPLSFKKGTWTLFTYQTFKLDKKSVITLNGFLRLKGQQQFYELSTFGALNTSINRKFLKEKLIVTLSLSDMFFSNKNNFSITQGSINATGFRQSDTRRIGINLRYSFGIRKKEEGNNMFNAEPPITN